MHLGMDISNALQQLETIKAAVDQSEDPKLQSATNDDLNFLINLLESPVLRSIATLNDSMAMLATQVAHHPSILPADFEITLSGELELQSRNLYGGLETEEEQRVPQISPSHSIGYPILGSPQPDRILGLEGNTIDANMSHQQAINMLQQARGLVELVARSATDEQVGMGIATSTIVNSEWAQVEVINLVNDGTGLGFGIIGARTSGVIVKTILAGGVADRDGRLRSGDHILQIGDAHLLDMVSEQVAGVLRASGTRVRLVVARPTDPSNPVVVDPGRNNHPMPPVVPARLLTEPLALDRYLMESGSEPVFNIQPELSFPLSQSSSHDHSSKYSYDRTNPDPDSDTESPEVDRFTVQLVKDENGLGITIAGYVCEKEELSGIFVKSVTTGSAAALSGCIRVNDRIVAVDGVSLAGQTNQRAVDALKSSGHIVTLQLERYLRGPKYEQLQQAIAANEIRPSSTPAAINPFLDMHRPDSGRSSSRSPAAPDIQMTHFDKGSEVLHYRQDEADITPPDSLDTASVVETSNHNLNLTQPSRQPSTFDLPATPETEESIRQKWQSILGPSIEIVVGWVMRGSGGGLGISLEGTVDVEGGREVRPHHYVRSVLPEGPVGRAGVHRPGDELLEVNGHRLLGMNHLEVVSILKELPARVCMVCARPRAPPSPPALPVLPAPIPPPLPALHDPPAGGALVKAKSDGSLAGVGALGSEEGSIGMGGTLGPSGTLGAGLGAPGGKLRSRSLEPLTGLAMWASEPQIIELVKGERGLGFSILDYQDPLRPAHTVVVIRSLVPGGVAQQDGRLIPGDRLLFVNEQNLENATLDQAVQALKGAPRGVVRIGVAKPLPLADNIPPPTTNTPTFNKMNTQ